MTSVFKIDLFPVKYSSKCLCIFFSLLGQHSAIYQAEPKGQSVHFLKTITTKQIENADHVHNKVSVLYSQKLRKKLVYYCSFMHIHCIICLNGYNCIISHRPLAQEGCYEMYPACAYINVSCRFL